MPSFAEIPAQQIPGGSSALWRGPAEMAICLAAMTAGLRLDIARIGYLNLNFCAADSTILQTIVIHAMLLPASCLTMYATAMLALCSRGTGDSGWSRGYRVTGDALFATAQIAAGAILMDAPPFARFGDGFLRAWFAMTAAMAVSQGLRWAIRRSNTRPRGNDHASV